MLATGATRSGTEPGYVEEMHRIVLVVASLVSCASPALAAAPPACVAELDLPLAASEAKVSGYAAWTILRDTGVTPVADVAGTTIDGEPLLWLSPDRSQRVVDALWFGDLTVVDVGSLGAGERAVVGAMKPEATGRISLREVMAFLLRIQAVRVDAGGGSHVCLASEGTIDGTYRAVFTAGPVAGRPSALGFAVDVGPDGTIGVTRS
jgi:hypothetical protein